MINICGNSNYESSFGFALYFPGGSEIFLFQLLQAEEDGGQIIWTSPSHWLFDEEIDCLSCFLMHWSFLSHCFPDQLNGVSWLHPFKDAIAAEKNEVFFSCQFELANVRLRGYNTFASSQLGLFCFYISDGSGDGQLSGQNAEWTYYFLSLIVEFSHLCSVYFSSSLHNSILLSDIAWSMVPAEIESHFSSFSAHDSSGISYIGHIASVVNKESDDSTGSTFINAAILFSVFPNSIGKNCLCLLNCLC